jgi:hypothetical protein
MSITRSQAVSKIRDSGADKARIEQKITNCMSWEAVNSIPMENLIGFSAAP